MKRKNVIAAVLVIIAIAIIFFWYKSPVSTIIKDCYWTSKTGTGVLFTDCTVDTYRNGDIIATIPAAQQQIEFSQLKWNESLQQWDAIYL